MNPGIADMPFASIVWPLFDDGAPAATDTILPPRTTIEPRSITVPLPTTMCAFVIVRSCAESGAVTTDARTKVAAINDDVFIVPP